MKKFKFAILAALIFTAALPLTAQTFTSQQGVTFFAGQPATATQTATVNIPNKSAEGNLQITMSAITGSPSGCQLAMYSVSNATQTAPSAAEQTPTFTVTTGTHAQTVAAVSAADVSTDSIKAVYTCSVYPTAGTVSISFAPVAPLSTAALTVATPVSVTNVVTGDPCLNSNVAKSSVVVNVTSATTTQLVAISGAKATYACGFTASVVATAPTILFEYGTSTNCTGTNALTGTFAIATGSIISWGTGSTMFTAPASNGLCIVTGGSGSPSFQGVLTFVQQ